jgi:outer membrane protein OmpA-like peptidoglycan-associated protein
VCNSSRSRELRRRVSRVATLAAVFGCATTAHAQDSAPGSPHRGEQLTVSLATFGQGDHVWERFGHNAIWIRDAASGTTTSYNYGMFSFEEPGFIWRFVRGRMLYWMGVNHADDEVAAYQQRNRSVWVQQLQLSAEQKYELRQFLDWNWLPDNSRYLYHYFYDNCSTRVRDALDRATGGAIRAQLAGVETGTTYRWHSLRLTGESLPVYTGLVLGLGAPTDRPIDAWEESFIPMQFMAHIRTVRVPGPDGDSVPLVAEERTLFQAVRPAEATAPPNRWPSFLLAGSLLGAALVGFARRARSRPRAAVGVAVALSAWGVIAGFFGLILTFLWLATDHTTSYGNQNLLQVNPLSLLFAFAAPLALLRRNGTHRLGLIAWRTALALLALSVAGLLLQMFPGFAQVNGPIIALALPLHLASVLSLRQAYRPGASFQEDASTRVHAADTGGAGGANRGTVFALAGWTMRGWIVQGHSSRGSAMYTILRNTTAVVMSAALSATLLGGCSSLSPTARGAVIGAAAGGAVGGAVGKATGSTARGAIIGAAVGGTAGAIIGAQMDKQRAELESGLEGAKVERYGEGLLVTFASGLLFDYNSAVVKGEARRNLTNLANSLRNYPETELLIVGHTDSDGSDAYNQALSERRSQAAKDYLVTQSVRSDRIRTMGRGESEPVAANETDAGKSQNRRVEVAIFASEAQRKELLRRHGGGSE